MEALFEILIPIIVVVFWLLSQFLGNKEDKDGQGGQQQRPFDQGDSEQRSAEEDRRAVQEEIRRKIEERRRQLAGEETGQPAPRQQTAPPPPPSQQTRLEREGQQSGGGGMRQEPVGDVSQRSRMEERYGGTGQHGFPEAGTESEEPPPYEAPRPKRNYQAEIDAARERAAEARRRAQQIRRDKMPKQRAGSRGAYAYDSDPHDNIPLFAPGADIGEQVRAVLADPQATRKAVIFQEVLGTPVGMRRDGAMIPKWRE